MYLVYDVGGTSIKYAWMTSDGGILEKGKIKTPNKPSDEIGDFIETIGNIYDVCKQKAKEKRDSTSQKEALSTDNPNEYEIQDIAIDLPGQVDVDNGIVYGGGALRYMHKVPLQELIEKRCDGIRVSLENDAKAAALAEVWKGNASDVQDACVLIFGTGIGGAVIKDRHVHRGKHLLAGEVSFAIDEMTFEDVEKIRPIEGMDIMEAMDEVPYFWAAHGATVAMCHKLAIKKGLSDDEVSGELVYKWADEGDEASIDALERMYYSIAKNCLNLYVTFDPEVILIGGGISAEPRFVEGIKRYVNRMKRITLVYDEIKIDTCKFRNDSNLLGALFNFKQKYEGVS